MYKRAELEKVERAHLVATTAQEGFKVLLKIMEGEIAKFNEALLNVKPGDVNELVARQATAQAAAQFYQGLVRTLNREKEQYIIDLAGEESVENPTESLEIE